MWHSTIKYWEREICLFVKGLIYDLHILSMHMTSKGEGFIEVSDYVKMLERVTQVDQAKMLDNKCNNVGNFSGS